MKENELTEAFERILPEQPSAKGWAGRARRRRQQQRGIVGAVAVAVVAAFAIPLGLHLGTGPQVMTTPAPTTTQQPDEEVQGEISTACRKAQDNSFNRTDPVNGKLPGGATKLWLCGGNYLGVAYEDQLMFRGPQEALTEGVDAAVDAFNALTWQEGVAVDCASSGEVYHLLVEYPDGSTLTLEGNFAPDGCQHFEMSGGIVEGADRYLTTLQDLWTAQREGEDPAPLDVNMCPGFTSVFTLEPADLGHGHGCVVQRVGNELMTGVSLLSDDLPDDLLAQVRDAVSTGGQPLDRYEAFNSDEQIVLLSSHNDPVTLSWGIWGDVAGLAWNNPQRRVWYPDEALVKQLDEYFSTLSHDSTPGPQEVVTSPASSETRRPLVSPECAEAVDSLTELPGAAMPASATRAWLCNGGSHESFYETAPPEPLTLGVDRVIAGLSALDPIDDAPDCTNDMSHNYLLRLDHPDGSHTVLQMYLGQLPSCLYVTDGTHFWAHPEGFLDLLKQMWVDQRAVTDVNVVITDDVCQSNNSLMDIDVRDITHAVICPSSWSPEDEVPSGLVMSDELVQIIVDGLTESEPNPPQPGGLMPEAVDQVIIMVTRFGDPVTAGADHGAISVLNKTWTPTGHIRQQLIEAGLRL